MFFFLSKTMDLLLDPWWWGVLPLLVALVALRRGKQRVAVGSLGFGVAVLVFFSLPSVSDRLWHALEADAPDTYKKDTTYDVVVLLGGAVIPGGTTRDEASWGDNIDRLIVTRELLHSGKARFVIVSGGVFREGFPTEAEFLAKQLEAWGIERERIIVEARAVNTKENASLSKDIITQRGFSSVLMVTSAFHMTRAFACFQAVGLTPDTLPVDFRMREPGAGSSWFPRTRTLNESAEALREWFGRLVYRVTG